MRHRWAAVLALLVLAAGCATKPPDYQSVWSSTPATTTTPSPQPVPIAAYFEQQGVTAEPMTPTTLTDLTVSMPQPPGWTIVNDPNQQSVYQLLRKTGVAPYPPTATLVVFKLNGRFDAAEAIKHGYADAQLSDGFHQLNASMANFKGFPSAMIEGSYNANDQRLHTYNRIVLATGPPPANQRYLVQFTVTTAAIQAAPQAKDVQQLIGGFSVAPRQPPSAVNAPAQTH